jgi:hypothetical protein
VTGQVFEDVFFNCKNQTGSTITRGTVVMAVGTFGASGRILIAPAIADGSVNSEYILGTAAQDILNGADGLVYHFGKDRGLNTTGASCGETWADRDVLYCSATTPGCLTKVLPTAPNLKVPVAFVIRAGNNGTLFIRPSHFPDLNQINDVQLTSPTTGQTLIYNSVTGVWSNQTPADPSATNELQTLSTGTNTLTLSNGGGTVTVDTDPLNDVTGSGTNGQVSFWTGAQTQSGDNNFTYGTTLEQLSIRQNLSGQNSVIKNVEITSENVLSTTGVEETALQLNYNSSAVSGTGGGGKIGLKIEGTGVWNRNIGTYVAGIYVPKYAGTTYNNYSDISAKFDHKVVIGGTGFANILTIGQRPAVLQLEPTATADQNTPAAIVFNVGSGTGLQGGMLGYQGNSRLSAVWFRRSPTTGAGEIVFATNSTNGGDLIDRGIVNKDGQWGIGTTTVAANTALTIRGSGSTSTTWTAQFHNSAGNNNALMVRDDGRVGIGTSTMTQNFNVGGTSYFNSTVFLNGNLNDNRNNGFIVQSANTVASNRDLTIGNATYQRILLNAQGLYLGTSFPASPYLFYVNGGTATSTVVNNPIYLRPTQPQAGGNTAGGDIIMMLPDGTGTARKGAVLVGTETATGSSAIIEFSSTDRGVLFPRMTTTQRNAITTPADGLVIYNTTDNKLQVRAAGAWVDLH